MIDDILDNVEKARNYVAKAEEVLHEEKEDHKKSRKVSMEIYIETVLYHISGFGGLGSHCHAHHYQGSQEQQHSLTTSGVFDIP